MKAARLKRDPYGLVGSVLAGRYHLQELVGIGGMGVVYRARHQVTTATVAVKILKPDLALSSPELVEAFFKEAKATVGLDHPYIIRVTDAAVTDEGLPFLVMEWLSGHTLEEEMRQRGPLPIAEVARLLEQIGEALAHAHARGIVHRDLKPSNVMLVTDHRGEPMVKILDFGIAKALRSTVSARVSRIIGTVHYASPEQFRPGASLDHRSDIYSLGIVAYQMLTGRVPFEAGSIERVIYEHLHEVPPSPRRFRPDLPPALDAVFERALAKDPEARFSSALELARAFRGAVGSGMGKLRLECRDAETGAGVGAALIYVDGRYMGRTDVEGTWVGEGLSPRAHVLEVESARHHAWRGTVQVEPEKECALVVELCARRLGGIVVRCAAAHADIFLDGVRVGATDEQGACTLDHVPIGRHRVEVRHPRYAPTQVECEVVEGEILPLALALAPRHQRLFERMAVWRRAPRRPGREELSPSSEAVPETISEGVTQQIAPAVPTQAATRPLAAWREGRFRRAIAVGGIGLGLAGVSLALWLWRHSEREPSFVVETVSHTPAPPLTSKPEPRREPPKSSLRPLRRPPSAAPPVASDHTRESPQEAAPTPEPSARIEDASDVRLRLAEHVRRGNAYFTAQQYEEALREYHAARELDPSNPDVYYLIGLVHERRGEYAAAHEAFRHCTAGPYAAVARNHLKMLEKKLRKP
jgi:hypothetical protein